MVTLPRLPAQKNAKGNAGVFIAPCIAAVAFIYLALSPIAAMPIYDAMIFDPDHDGNMNPHQIAGCPVETVTIAAPNGHKVFAWYAHNPHSDKTVLLSHGKGGDLSDMRELVSKLLNAGASVFAYDYEGFGLSEGKADVEAACEDGQAAYLYLTQKRAVPANKLFLFGESLGTGVTCQIAKKYPCAGVVLQSPFTSLLDIAREKDACMYLYPNAFFPSQRLDSLSVLKGKHPRLLVVHGAQDDMVPLRDGIELYRKAAIPKQMLILPDGHHDDLPEVDTAMYDTTLKRFLAGV